MKVKKDVAATENEPQNRLVPAVNNNDNFWNIHDELVTVTIKCSDKPGNVPVELRQFLNQPIL